MEKENRRKFLTVETQAALNSALTEDDIAELLMNLIGALLRQRQSLLRLSRSLENSVLSNLGGRGTAALALSALWATAMNPTTNLFGQVRILSCTYPHYERTSVIVSEHLAEMQNVLQLYHDCYNKMMFA